jgi:hypothetical protein
MTGKLTKKGERMLQKARSVKYNAMDYIQVMMAWANDNLEQEDILEIIKGPEGKVVGLERLQLEVMQLEERLKMKRKELVKKTMALYFMKQEKPPAENQGQMIGFNEWMTEVSSRYPK